MNLLSQAEGYVFLAIFWLVVFSAIRYFFRKRTTSSGFLVSDRSVGLFLGIVTVAVSWVWAPALFVSSQKSFEQGVPGLFWFILPNAGAVLLLAFLAGRMRKVFDQGYTLPEFIGKRLGKKNEILYSIAILVIQTYAVILNLTAALLMLNLVTGIPKEILIVVLGSMMVSLSALKGIRSSLVQDSVKAAMIAVVGLVVIPWAIGISGGVPTVIKGLGGMKGTFTNLFDPTVAWTFGVPFSISLLSAVVLDQQQWQRVFSMKTKTVKQTFLIGSLVFALIPLLLGMLGFVAAGKGNISATQNQLIGFSTVLTMLPAIATIAFTAMVLAGLVATGSAALNAISSVGAKNVYKFYKPKANDNELIRASRISMVVIVVIGMGVSLIPNIQLLYLVLLIGAFRASLFVPTILSLYSTKLSGTTAFTSIITGMAVGLPLFVYGSIVKNATLASFGSLIPIIITLLICGGGILFKPSKFKFSSLNSAEAAPAAAKVPARKK